MTVVLLPTQINYSSEPPLIHHNTLQPVAAVQAVAAAALVDSMQHAVDKLPKADFPSGQAPQAKTEAGGRSYTILKEVGDGSFGTVWLADWHSPLSLPPGTLPPGPSSRPEYAGKNLVAIKRMKKAFTGGWEECMRLKELKSLRTIPMHPNIIPLYDAFLMPSSKELYFVFECMEGNLYQLTKSRKGRPLAGGLVASLFFQMLSGLHHIHQAGYFHRDMKPENVLITTTGLADYPNGKPSAPPGSAPERDVTVIVKLADFGLARETRSKPPYTEYVSTRWYRAPEVLLRDREYSNPVDMWALGTILAEMVTLKPLFPGGTEVDQVHRICEVLGNPSDAYDVQGMPRGGGGWSRGLKLAKIVHFEFQPMAPIDFSTLFDLRIVPMQLIDCIFLLLRFDPKLRITTQQCLQHPYFHEVAARLHPLPSMPQQVLPPTPTSFTSKPNNGFPMPTAQVPMASPPHSQQGHLDSMAGRAIPPSHSHGTPAPAPEYAQSVISYRSRGSTGSSAHSAALNGIHFAAPGTASTSNSDPYDVARRQSVPLSVFSGNEGQAMAAGWPSPPPGHHFAAGPLPVPAFRQPRLSTAVSTFYDGSIFEGIAPTREASIMSFNMYGGGRQEPTAASAYAAAYQQRQGPAPAPPRTVYDDDRLPVANPTTLQPQSGSSNLKRSPSERSGHQVDAPSVPLAPKDAKKAKKEAEKAAKEAERVKREAAQKAARERARAVMQKKSQLAQAGDALGGFNNASRSTKPDAVDKGKGRATMPNIAEDGASQFHASRSPSLTSSHLLPDARFRAKRRGEDDDDVHSVSSNETRGSGDRRMSSNTFESDPGPGRAPWQSHLARATSMASLGSQASSNPGALQSAHLANVTRPPGSSSSSVDGQLALNFSSLSATDGWRQAGSPSPSGGSGPNGFFAAGAGSTNARTLPYLPQMAYPAPKSASRSIPSYQLTPGGPGSPPPPQ